MASYVASERAGVSSSVSTSPWNNVGGGSARRSKSSGAFSKALAF